MSRVGRLALAVSFGIYITPVPKFLRRASFGSYAGHAVSCQTAQRSFGCRAVRKHFFPLPGPAHFDGAFRFGFYLMMQVSMLSASRLLMPAACL